MQITSNIFLKIISHCRLIHHIKGRLRVRVSSSIKDEIENLGINLEELKNLDFKEIVDNINGINKIKFNKLVGSLTIEYNNDIFPKQMWDKALNGDDIDNLVETINKTIKERV